MKSFYNFEIFNIESRWISKEKRFDASFYAKDVIAAKVLIDELKNFGISIKSIQDCSKDVYWPGRFKRNYVSEEEGEPFLTPSEIFMLVPESKKFVIDFPDNLNIEEKWILITRSGTVGRCLISNNLIKEFVLSDDLIRLIPNEDNYGYLYAYMETWVGKTFLTKNQYGSTIKHIEPEHLANIPIPIIPEFKEIHEKISRSHRLKEKAQKLLVSAKNEFYDELSLPQPNKDEEVYLGTFGRLIKSFSVKASELELRFDAPFYEPKVQLIKQYLSETKSRTDLEVKKLSEVVKEDIFIPSRFKRPYVKNKKDGVLFLSGSNLVEFKPMGTKYLWKKFNKLDKYKVYEGYVLVSARGTVGRPFLITESLDEVTASDNILRIIVDSELVLPSYLTAFLSTKYASYQIHAQKAGSVQDLLQPVHLNNIEIPLPDLDTQEKIGKAFVDAYALRYQANKIEKDAINYLEKKLLEYARN